MIAEENLCDFNVDNIIIHDKTYISLILGINEEIIKKDVDFHYFLISKGVKAYRNNDGWVNRKEKRITFDSYDKKKGWYLSNKELKVGDLIFIGNRCDGGRFAEIIEVGNLREYHHEYHQTFWSITYKYKPLNETLDGEDIPYITENTLSKKQKILRFLGLLKECMIQKDI